MQGMYIYQLDRRFDSTIPLLYLQGLFVFFDRFEKLSEVALTETTAPRPLDGELGCLVVGNHATNSLDDFEKEGRPVAYRFRKQLQQDSFFVGIREDAQFFQLLVLFGCQLVSESIWEFSVVSITRSFHQFETKQIVLALSHLSDGSEYIFCLESQVLETRALVLLEIGLNLGFSSSVGRLVQRQENLFAVARQDDRVEPRIDRSDVLGGKLGKLVESRKGQDPRVGLLQIVHVPDRVVDSVDTVAFSEGAGFDGS
mmetsp:Transcript_851/g.2060  ORF Transcript_851/g.2060 Transcript_851/m.2060 type:complete len:256 (+) Transcript_851:283-1050(+)